MNSPRRHSRELALKALYQAEINNSDQNESLNQINIEMLFAPAIENVVRKFDMAISAKANSPPANHP